MKKGIIVLLITVLAAGMAFAGLTGSADVNANLDLNALKAKESALALANGSEIKVSLGLADLAVAPAALEEGAEAPAISVDFAASFSFKIADKDGKLDAKASITKAAIKGLKWSVDLLGSKDGLNYATMDGYNAKSIYTKNPGVTVSYEGVGSIGVGYASKGNWNVAFESAPFEVIDGLTIQGGASYVAKSAGATSYEGWVLNDNGNAWVAEHLAKNDDGTYAKTSDVAAEQAAVFAAENKVADAKAAMDKAPKDAANAEALKDAYDDAVEALSKAKADLSNAVADIMDDISYNKKAVGFRTVSTGTPFAKEVYKADGTTKENVLVLKYNAEYPYEGTPTYYDKDAKITTDASKAKFVKYAELGTAPVYGTDGKVKDPAQRIDSSKIYYTGSIDDIIIYDDRVIAVDKNSPNTDNMEYAYTPAPAKSELGASVKATYASDMLNGSAAVDMFLNTVAKSVAVEAKASASFIGAGLDVYYANAATKKIDDVDVDFAHVLNAKISVDANKFVAELPVAASVTFGMENILNKTAGQERSINVSAKVGYEAITFEGSFGYGLATKKIALAGKLGYACEYAEIELGATYGTTRAMVDELHTFEDVKKLGMTFSAENSTLIPGATLGLSWNATDLTNKDLNDTNKIGIVTASCGIAF